MPADHPSRDAEIPPPSDGFLDEGWTWPQIRSLPTLPRLRRWASSWVRFVLLRVEGCYRGPFGLPLPYFLSSLSLSLLFAGFEGWFVQGVLPPLSHGLPLRNAGDTERAERRKFVELPEGRAVELRTRLRRDTLWQVFLEWLDAIGVDRELFLHTDGLVDIDSINAILARYGRELYRAGRPYSTFLRRLIASLRASQSLGDCFNHPGMFVSLGGRLSTANTTQRCRGKHFSPVCRCLCFGVGLWLELR